MIVFVEWPAMSSFWISLGCCVVLFLAIVTSGKWGHRLGCRVRNIHGHDLSTSTADAAILSLLGLLIAFTFSSAYARYESRRQLIVEEVNAIGTAGVTAAGSPTRRFASRDTWPVPSIHSVSI